MPKDSLLKTPYYVSVCRDQSTSDPYGPYSSYSDLHVESPEL